MYPFWRLSYNLEIGGVKDLVIQLGGFLQVLHHFLLQGDLFGVVSRLGQLVSGLIDLKCEHG